MCIRDRQGDDDLSESMEDLSQDLEMSARPDQKDMVSAEEMCIRDRLMTGEPDYGI